MSINNYKACFLFPTTAFSDLANQYGLHLSLDIIFEEDKHRYQDKIGAANLSLLRKVALAVLAKDTSLKCGKPARQMRAATSTKIQRPFSQKLLLMVGHLGPLTLSI
ncbi:hypothetical protein [Candidatus Rhabdochlamydia sp. W815]|uniref:hypothetical protein n=1 Tax=Candidatus Rhabdochlamydia sp. W815 TaxID=2720721 RepID=UPI001BFCC7BE|nr:hypothetical protein [Candidatus Rhabdochlamydia sp. W815]